MHYQAKNINNSKALLEKNGFNCCITRFFEVIASTMAGIGVTNGINGRSRSRWELPPQVRPGGQPQCREAGAKGAGWIQFARRQQGISYI